MGQFSPAQEIYSIDECFPDLTGLPGAGPGIGTRIRQRVPRWIGIPTCAGIGATKTLARLASHLTKSLPRLLGVCDPSSLDREDTPAPRQQIMSTRSFGLPVRELAELEQAAGLFTSRAAEKPRQRHSHVAAVQVFIRTSHFSTGPWHADSAVMPLS
ncbi:Y-family DNA polymerase [Castellaniella sp. WN]